MPDFRPVMKDYKKLTPFKFQILQSFPFIAEDFDSLTNYELLCKVVEYLNDVIFNENNVEENVSNLYNSFVELQNYVNNYFDNLDVQEEINNKLDAMAEDGTLQEIIADYLNSKAVFGFDNVDSMINANNLIDGSYAKTLGYYDINDGGSSLYKIRNKQITDIEDNGSIIFLENNNLVAELIIDDYVNYNQFGAKGDGITDDFVYILNTHNYANSNGLIVMGNSNSTYYVKNITETIKIKNNVNWNNCNFIIDDSDSTNLNNIPLFEVVSPNEYRKITGAVTSIERGQSIIPQLAGNGDIIVEAINSNKRDFIRTGGVGNIGSYRTEIFRVNNTGEVLDFIFFDFDQVTSLGIKEIDKETLKIENGNFTTKINDIDSYIYYSRNIVISRDNVIVDCINHYLDNENVQTSSPYSGFIYTNLCYNISINNCVLTGHKGFRDGDSNTTRGNYDIQNWKTLYCYINNLKQSNSTTNSTYWGLHTSNYSKNLYFNKCSLSRIDAHLGVYNISIDDCEVGYQSMRLIGGGLCKITNTKVYNAQEFVNLRNDYGASWNGDIEIKDCYLKDQAGSYVRSIIRAINSGNHNYGYKCYAGRNIKIENFEYNSSENDRCVILHTGNITPSGLDYLASYEDNNTNNIYPHIYPNKISCKNLYSKIATNYFILTQQKEIENEYAEDTGFIPLTADSNNAYSLSNEYKFNTEIIFDNVTFPTRDSETYKNGLCSLWDLTSFQVTNFQNTHRPIFYMEIKNCKNLKLGLSGRGCYLQVENCELNLITEGYGGDYCFFNLINSIINYRYDDITNISNTKVFNVSPRKLIIDNCRFTIQDGLTLDDIREYELPFKSISVSSNQLKFTCIYYNNRFWNSFISEFENNSYFSNLIANNNLSPSDIITNIKTNKTQ